MVRSLQAVQSQRCRPRKPNAAPHRGWRVTPKVLTILKSYHLPRRPRRGSWLAPGRGTAALAQPGSACTGTSSRPTSLLGIWTVSRCCSISTSHRSRAANQVKRRSRRHHQLHGPGDISGACPARLHHRPSRRSSGRHLLARDGAFRDAGLAEAPSRRKVPATRLCRSLVEAMAVERGRAAPSLRSPCARTPRGTWRASSVSAWPRARRIAISRPSIWRTTCKLASLEDRPLRYAPELNLGARALPEMAAAVIRVWRPRGAVERGRTIPAAFYDAWKAGPDRDSQHLLGQDPIPIGRNAGSPGSMPKPQEIKRWPFDAGTIRVTCAS